MRVQNLATYGITALTFSLALLTLDGCALFGTNEDTSAVPAIQSLDGLSPQQIAEQQGLKLVEYDLNRDGRPDIFKYFKISTVGTTTLKGPLVRKVIDLNHDGRIDLMALYDDKQALIEERTDLDFDSRFDEVIHYRAGKVVRKEIDLNYDGTPDVIKYYKKEVLLRVEANRNGDGQIDTWEYYEQGQLDRVGVDLDRDGKADKWDRRQAKSEEAPLAANKESSEDQQTAATTGNDKKSDKNPESPETPAEAEQGSPADDQPADDGT
jgi:hypothetical protein